jgi:hypothetical protein
MRNRPCEEICILRPHFCVSNTASYKEDAGNKGKFVDIHQTPGGSTRRELKLRRASLNNFKCICYVTVSRRRGTALLLGGGGGKVK